MKKIISALLVGIVTIMSLSVNAFAYRAEWDAEVFDDNNYNLFGEGAEFSTDAAVDAELETGWQKEQSAMNANGYISKECFIAMEWEDAIVVETINIWWRSSTRAEASTNGYVVQLGTKSGNSYKWTNANVTYRYNAKSEENGRFVCDTVIFTKKTEIHCFRILIKRGIDYVDPNRGFSPKVNEIEITAAIKEEPVTPPVSSQPPVSSEEPVSSVPPVSSEETSSAVSSEVLSEETSSKPSAPAFNTSSQSISSQGQVGEQGRHESLIPWLILAAVSLLVIGACAVLLVGNNKKSQ